MEEHRLTCLFPLGVGMRGGLRGRASTLYSFHMDYNLSRAPMICFKGRA